MHTDHPSLWTLKRRTAHSRHTVEQAVDGILDRIAGNSRRGAGPPPEYVALARTAWQLARRYPVPALCVVGAGIAFAMFRHRQSNADN